MNDTPIPDHGARPGDQTQSAMELDWEWQTDARWDGIRRDYSADDVVALRGCVLEEHTLARRGAGNLWRLIQDSGTPGDPHWIAALGALTGNQAVQQVRAGLKAIYLSGRQVAADANSADQIYPDQSLNPVDSIRDLVRRINNALLRADQIESPCQSSREHVSDPATLVPGVPAGGAQPVHDWLAPIVAGADAEPGLGGPLNAYELMRSMIEAGAAGVHWADQLASEKSGQMGGKVLVPTGQHIRTLNAARLAADVAGIPTLVIARTDSLAASLITSDHDERDRAFLTGERTAQGFYGVRGGAGAVIARGLAYAPYADLLWFESAEPDLQLARRFAEAIHREFPGKRLAYCAPSFNGKSQLDDDTIARFQRELAAMGYAFQFVTPAGFGTGYVDQIDTAPDSQSASLAMAG
jgi:isocitrate lyase